MATISSEIVKQAADDVAGLFQSYQPRMDEAYSQIEGNLSVSMNCTFKPSESSGGIDADISIKFKLDEVNEKNKRTYFDGKSGNGPIFDYADEKLRRLREILFRDFREFAASLIINQHYYRQPLLVRKFA